jgi:phosphotriesterase-related protein
MDDATAGPRTKASRMSRRRFLAQAAAAAAIPGPLAAAAATQGAAAPARRPGTVQTVLGPIDAGGLGFTLAHEHLFSSSTGMWRIWPELMGGRANFIARVVEHLRAAREAGIRTIVDVTTADLGRDIRLAEEVSHRSGMQIGPCTGQWLYPALSMSARTVEELTGFFIREIEQGIEDTRIKAGVIKVATDSEGITPFHDRALRAAARASKATGTPIVAHTNAFVRSGEAQAAIFEAEGLDPARVCLGHSDNSVDMNYLTGLLRRGFLLGMDHFSRGQLPPGQAATPEIEPLLWRHRATRLKALVDAGFTGQLLLSNDWIHADSAFATGTLAALERINPDGILFINRRVIPYLLEIGVSAAAIHTMTVENPRRFLAGV